MTGASNITNGVSGLVPAPQKGEQDYFLRGDGTWQPVIQNSVQKFSDEFILTEDNVIEVNKISIKKIDGIEVIQKKVESLENETIQLKEKYDIQQSAIANLDQELIKVVEILNGQKNEVLKLQNSIVSIENTSKVQSQKISQLNTRIEEIESTNQSLVIDFNALVAEVEKQKIINQDLTIIVQNLDDRLTWGSIQEEEINNG